MKKEFSEFIANYLVDRDLIYSNFISLKDINNLIHIISNGKDYEHPDGYSVVDNELYMIEHFQFDSSVELKGSSLMINENLIEKEIRNEIKTKNIVNKEINTNSDLINYYKNLESHFIKHVNQFKKYKIDCNKEISIKPINISLILFIEDKTLYGALENDMKTPFEIIKTKEFMDMWKNYPYVKAIFFGGNILNKTYCRLYFKEENELIYDSIIVKNPIIMNNTMIMECKMEVKKNG